MRPPSSLHLAIRVLALLVVGGLLTMPSARSQVLLVCALIGVWLGSFIAWLITRLA